MADVEHGMPGRLYFSDCPDDLVDTEEGWQRTTHELGVGVYVTHQNVPYVSFEGDLYPWGKVNKEGQYNPAEDCYQFTMSVSDFNAYVDALVKLRDDIKE